jgi:hypothetical protein
MIDSFFAVERDCPANHLGGGLGTSGLVEDCPEQIQGFLMVDIDCQNLQALPFCFGQLSCPTVLYRIPQ